MAENNFPNESDSEVVSKIIDDVRKVFIESDSEMDLETLARLEKIWISKLAEVDVPDEDEATENKDDCCNGLLKEATNDVLLQLDGAVDSSDDDDDLKSSDDTADEDDADEDSDSDLDPDGESYAGGIEMSPPGSGDDVTDEEAPSDLFDTENVVVCKYDKISRLRMRWKLKLMDGVMHLNGRDYVFQKAHGEVDW